MQREPILRLVLPLALACVASSCGERTTRAQSPAPPPSAAGTPSFSDPREAVIDLTRDPVLVGSQFIRALRNGELDRTYALMVPAYQKITSRDAHNKLAGAWRETVGPIRGVKLVDRTIGLDEQQGTSYAKLAYAVPAAKQQGVILLTLMPYQGRWRIARMGLHWQREAGER